MQVFIKQCRHGNFLLLRGDMISQLVDVYGEWSETEIELFRAIVPRDGVCVEVGSNIGMHAVPLSRMCEDGHLYCYEPQRPIFYTLCGNLALNNRLNVVARQLGVGAISGRVTLQVSDYEQDWNYGSFSLAHGFSTENKFEGMVRHDEVDVVSLDDDHLLARHDRLDFLKIDAEGLDIDVLRGARGLIAKHHPDIFVEANTADAARAILAELGEEYRGYWFFNARARRDNYNRIKFMIPGADFNIILRHVSRDQHILETALELINPGFDEPIQVPIYTNFTWG